MHILTFYSNLRSYTQPINNNCAIISSDEKSHSDSGRDKRPLVGVASPNLAPQLGIFCTLALSKGKYMNEWIIKLVDVGYKFGRYIYIFRRLPNGDIETLDGTKVVEGEDFKPAFFLNPEQLQALANALDNNGFKPQEGFVEGKLEATERHLTDLRKLLKL